MRLKSIKDISSFPSDQMYICDDPQLMKKHGFKKSFNCGVFQIGEFGMVVINYSIEGMGRQFSESTYLKWLKPIDGQRWSFDRNLNSNLNKKKDVYVSE